MVDSEKSLSDHWSQYLENMGRNDPSSKIREVLVGEPLYEGDINVNDYILFAQPQPTGVIQVQIAKVGQTIDGRLKEGVRAFRGVLPSGNDGHYEVNLDSTLQTTRNLTIHRNSSIYDWSATLGDYTTAMYQDGTFVLYWADEEPIDHSDRSMHKLKSNSGITLYTKGDPNRRLIPPGSHLVNDQNTLHFENDSNHFKIVQHIENGPTGIFTLPAYRKITKEDYLYFSDSAEEN